MAEPFKYKITKDGVEYIVKSDRELTYEEAEQHARPWYESPGATQADRNAAASLPGNTSGAVNPLTIAAGTTLVGAGRSLDKVREGTKQAMTAGNVIGRELAGVDTKEPLQRLAQQEKFQKEQDAAYLPLQQQHPFLTGIGEAAPMLGLPVGQQTAAARIFAPAIGMGTMEAAKYGSPAERAKAGAFGFGTGVLGGTVGEIANSVVSPTASTLTAAQQKAAANAANKIGVKLLPSQLTGSANMARAEDMLSRVQGGAGVMADFDRVNKNAVNRHAASAINENTNAITKDVFFGARSDIGDEFNRLRGSTSLPIVQPLFDAIDSASAKLSRGLKVQGKEEALTTLQGVKDRFYGNKQLTGDEYQSIVSDLGSLARESKNPAIAAAYDEVKRAMDAVAQGGNAPAWRAARQRNASLETLEKPNVVNEVTGDVNAGPLAREMDRQLGRANKEGKVSGPLVDIAEYHKALPPRTAGSPTFERKAASNVMDWLLTPAYWAAAKVVTSGLGRDYLAKGLLGDPTASRLVGLLARKSALPLAIGPEEAALMQMGLLNYQ